MFCVIVSFANFFVTKMTSLLDDSVLSPLDSWQERKSFPFVSSKRIQELLSSQLQPSEKLHPIPKKKSSFLVDHELLQSIAPLLQNATDCQSFSDTYFDNQDNDLLLLDGVWLCYRSFFSEEPLEPVLKLRTSVCTSETENTIQWAEFQGEFEILKLLHLAGTIPSQTSKLISIFGFPYLYIKTKRYFLRTNKIWVDFFGWADSPRVGASRGIFAIGGFGKNMASIPLGSPFEASDKYLGLMETFEQSVDLDEEDLSE